MIKGMTIRTFNELEKVVKSYSSFYGEDVDFRVEEIGIGHIELTFIFYEFKSVELIKEVMKAVKPNIVISVRCDWRLFLVATDFTEEDFIQFLTEEKPDEWVLKSIAENNKRVALLCEKYKLLVG
jgi:hypothetical protein